MNYNFHRCEDFLRSNIIHQSKHEALITFSQSYCLTFISLCQCCVLVLNCALYCAPLPVIHLRSTEKNRTPRQEIISQKQAALKILLSRLCLLIWGVFVRWDCT